MGRYLALLLISSLIVGPLSAISHEEALRIYNSNQPSASLFEADGYLFTEIKWDIEDSDSSDEEELGAYLSFFESYITSVEVEKEHSPFSEKFTKWLVLPLPFEVPQVERYLLKDKSQQGKGCHLVAFESAPLKKARAAYAEAKRATLCQTPEDWARRLNKVFQDLTTEQDKWNFFSLLGCPAINVIFANQQEAYGRMIPGTEAAWKELEQILDAAKGNDPFFKQNEILCATNYYRHPKLFYTKSELDPVEAQKLFLEAQSLYQKGKDLPRILDLLVHSLRKNPFSTESWSYLGGALRAKGSPVSATVAYLQAARLDPESPYAVKGLQQACKDAGFSCHAEGLKWYLLMKENATLTP